jgi:GT2 family glycosyltransferase
VDDDDAALVSVVTPCRKAREWLPRCIASVEAQGLDRVEHIVVDGASLDGTVELLRDSPHIRWRSEPDKGQSDAINKGLGLARGSLITWLNADDVLEAGAVDRVIAAWRTNPRAAVFYGDCAIVEGDQRSLWTPPPHIRAEDFDNRNPLPQVGTFVTSNALTDVGGVDDELHLAMDFDLFLRLSLAGHQFVYTGATLATFVLHAGSKSGEKIHGEFLREEASSLLAAGRGEAANVALGRASARAAALSDGRWKSGYWTTAGALSLAEQAGAHLEATRLLVQSGSIARALPHMLHPTVWRCATTRRALVSSARRFPQRGMHRWNARP